MDRVGFEPTTSASSLSYIAIYIPFREQNYGKNLIAQIRPGPFCMLHPPCTVNGSFENEGNVLMILEIQ